MCQSRCSRGPCRRLRSHPANQAERPSSWPRFCSDRLCCDLSEPSLRAAPGRPVSCSRPFLRSVSSLLERLVVWTSLTGSSTRIENHSPARRPTIAMPNPSQKPTLCEVILERGFAEQRANYAGCGQKRPGSVAELGKHLSLSMAPSTRRRPRPWESSADPARTPNSLRGTQTACLPSVSGSRLPWLLRRYLTCLADGGRRRDRGFWRGAVTGGAGCQRSRGSASRDPCDPRLAGRGCRRGRLGRSCAARRFAPDVCVDLDGRTDADHGRV